MLFKSQSGFTLVELLVVISIISLLSSISAVNVNAARVSARNGARLADVRNLLTAIRSYYIDHNYWPWYPDPTTDPRNKYSNGALICNNTWENTSKGMWCQSNRPCTLAACNNELSCDGETTWLPPLDKDENYFSPQAPRDPLSKNNCNANSFYDYRSAFEPAGKKSYFILSYYLELPPPQYPIGVFQECDAATRLCRFAIRGDDNGSLY